MSLLQTDHLNEAKLFTTVFLLHLFVFLSVVAGLKFEFHLDIQLTVCVEDII